jgi:hypothetical protein
MRRPSLAGRLFLAKKDGPLFQLELARCLDPESPESRSWKSAALVTMVTAADPGLLPSQVLGEADSPSRNGENGRGAPCLSGQSVRQSANAVDVMAQVASAVIHSASGHRAAQGKNRQKISISASCRPRIVGSGKDGFGVLAEGAEGEKVE